MNKLSFLPIESSVARHARENLKDEYGHALAIRTDQTVPCRHCLRMTKPGEPVVLLSYNPFGADHGPYSEVGPIFVHAHPCERYSDVGRLPADFQPRDLVLRAYDRAHAIADSAIAPAGQAERVALEFFANPAIAYIHVRHTTYGCYDFRIERG